MEDEYAEWLSDHKTTIKAITHCNIAIVDANLFHHVINKGLLLKSCEIYNIPHPKTIRIKLDNLSDIINKITFPALIKPDISNGSRGICKVDSESDFFEKAQNTISRFGSCTIQEFISNDHYYNVMLYRYSDGSWAPYVATKITRFYPINGGSSSFCTTIENEELIKPCKLLLQKLNWIGFADFDVLEDINGKFKIIEINPRVPASVHAAYVSGINFGQIIVADLINNEKCNMIYKPNEDLRFLGLDIAWFIKSPNRFKANPSWFKFWGKHLHYQEGGYKDAIAMAYSIFSGIKKQLSPSFRKAKSGMN